MRQTDLLMRELALLIAIATIPLDVQAAYEAGAAPQKSGAATKPARQQSSTATISKKSYAPSAKAVYRNPVWSQDFPDPFLLAWKGKFYAYATETRVTGFQVMESKDLVQWVHKGIALEVPWSRVHYWAPEVVHYRGRFYMTYSAENPQNKRHDIGIAVADHPLGPFKHATKLIEAPEGQRGVIDATIFFDTDGKPYIIYSEEDPRSVVLREMAPDLMSVIGEKTELIRPDRDWERGVVEAPTLLYRNGVYHLFYSAGPFQGNKANSRYSVSHAWSKTLRGPYEKRGSPLMETVDGKVYGPGHQAILTTPDGQMWMFYHGWSAEKEPHYGSNPDGRTLRMDRIVWRGNEPIVKGPTLSPQPVPVLAAASGKGRATTGSGQRQKAAAGKLVPKH